MTIRLNNGSNPSAISFNGTALTKVVFNGVVVWPEPSNATWRASGNSGFTVTGRNNLNPFISQDDTPTSTYTITIPALTYTKAQNTQKKSFQPSSGSPLWSNGSGGGNLAANSFTISNVSWTGDNGSTGTCSFIGCKFENGVLTLGSPLTAWPSGMNSLTTTAKTVTVTTYLHT